MHVISDKLLKNRGYEQIVLGPNHVGWTMRGTTKELIVSEENGRICVGFYDAGADCINDATFLEIYGPDALFILDQVLGTLEIHCTKTVVTPEGGFEF